jgi:hypothetical protein
MHLYNRSSIKALKISKVLIVPPRRQSKNKVEIGAIIAILGIIAVIFSVMNSYPKIEIAYYTKYPAYSFESSEWSKTDFNMTVNTKEVFSSSQICFRFKNTAEPLLQYVIPASNFKVSITSNAECENCNVNFDLGILQAQQTSDVCGKIKVTKNLSTLSLNVVAYWQALSMTVLSKKA